ncbi:MAG TPA: FprA family A-type flavoprotein [Methanocella sp.]|nr:FprA family A-type flavoprotein [Methanocella sp.]
MRPYYVAQIAKDVYWTGSKDWDRRLFDALIPLPQGTSYNSYLVLGSEKTALIDTVNPGFSDELCEKINCVGDVSRIDYLIMNHAEPDHASAVPVIMKISEHAVLIATRKGAEMAQLYFKVPKDRIKVVGDGDSLDLGGKTLHFIEAPWLHWPETMFTYLTEDRILFSCDYFGAHTAAGLYDDEVQDLIPLAQRYFGEIMMPYRRMGAKGLEKIRGLDIGIIAPAHGPVYRDPRRILDEYDRWTAGETKAKAVIVYTSMWGSTKRMADALYQILSREGIEVRIFNLPYSDMGDIARELVDARAIVLGSPTVIGGLHPLSAHAASLVKVLKPPARYAAFIGSYGWGGGAKREAQELLGPPMKIEIIEAVEVRGPANDEVIREVEELGHLLARKIRGDATPIATTSAVA